MVPVSQTVRPRSATGLRMPRLDELTTSAQMLRSPSHHSGTRPACVAQVSGLQMAGAGGQTAAQMPMLQALRYIVQREGIKALWKVRGGRMLLQREWSERDSSVPLIEHLHRVTIIHTDCMASVQQSSMVAAYSRAPVLRVDSASVGCRCSSFNEQLQQAHVLCACWSSRQEGISKTEGIRSQSHIGGRATGRRCCTGCRTAPSTSGRMSASRSCGTGGTRR